MWCTGGLSPLARGNPLNGRRDSTQVGPIPARAGQPHRAGAVVNVVWAYPRSRGATQRLRASTSTSLGLSPLARGNRADRGHQSANAGPIPARAGQPPGGIGAGGGAGAYPRSRGATAMRMISTRLIEGLSPLARGNHLRLQLGLFPRGPIPARAGQPAASCAWCTPSRAYPRSRGATSRAALTRWASSGLSPLARGNHRLTRRGAVGQGPIPARAGQPHLGVPRATLYGAYPRSRGATDDPDLAGEWAKGLSPLARGNLGQRPRLSSVVGPIPARAGQPSSHPAIALHTRAYPRSRGATDESDNRRGPAEGLSPLARGNLRQPHNAAVGGGPIPARAGQPIGQRLLAPEDAAYPRSRGATCKTFMK